MSSSSDQGERAGRSCPSTGHADLGVAKLNDALRSVLMNPTALALFAALHRDSLGRSAVGQIERYTGALPHLEANRKNWEKVLITAIDKVKPDVTTSSVATSNSNPKTKQKTRIGETALTRELNTLLQGRLPKIKVQNEWHVKSERESKRGALDLTFYDQSMFNKKAPKAKGSTSKVKAYGVIELGVVSGSKDLETLFFEKLCQGLIYLELLCDERLKGPMNSTIGTPHAVPSVDGEMILSVVALSETCERGIFATFLCEPRGADAAKWRVCLLSKKASLTIEESSSAFADMISVINAIKGFNPPTSWKYLGPNCSKVVVGNRGKAKVLRAYDTRVRPTHRSPEMYLQIGKVVDTCTTLFTYKEGRTPILDFRQGSRRGDQYIMVDRFFKLQGKLQIIAIPFIEGKPAYRTGAQAVNLITELEELHDKDIVHGDIRGFNSLHSSTYSKFIDFDYSGTAGQVWYPSGYVTKLEDGLRTKTRSAPIDKNHDVYALGHLLLRYHELDDGALEDQYHKTGVPKWAVAVYSFQKKLGEIEQATEEDGKELLKEMKVFFLSISDFPFRSFQNWDKHDTSCESKITQKGCAGEMKEDY